jgi:N-acetyl-gamma-glutamyl-phosphate reductase
MITEMRVDLPQVFIDGHAGTTGLQLAQRLRRREDVRIRILPAKYRKDPAARRNAARESAATVLCLPEHSARQAVALYEQTGTRILDASTAFRLASGWVYGLPEMDQDQRSRITSAGRVSNPGCYALAAILSIRPLIDCGLVDARIPLSIHALSGYSGGGAAMIERHEADASVRVVPRPYALTSRHKHLEEIRHYIGLEADPIFIPSIASFRQGMRVWIPLHSSQVKSAQPYDAILAALVDRYSWEARVRVRGHHGPREVPTNALEPTLVAGRDRIWLHVIRQDAGHVLIVAILDNLGKGAAGTAEQNLELMLGLATTSGRQVRAPTTGYRGDAEACDLQAVL